MTHPRLGSAFPFSALSKEVFHLRSPKWRNTSSRGRLAWQDPNLTSIYYEFLTTLLCAFRDANDTVPLKSAFFLVCTGVLQSSIKCLFASPKSTINTCLLSLERTKFDYIQSSLSRNLTALTSLWMNPRLWTSSIASNISICRNETFNPYQ